MLNSYEQYTQYIAERSWVLHAKWVGGQTRRSAPAEETRESSTPETGVQPSAGLQCRRAPGTARDWTH